MSGRAASPGYTPINRHGGLDNSGAPALLDAIAPQVIVLNNGPRKGLGQKVENLKMIINADPRTIPLGAIS